MERIKMAIKKYGNNVIFYATIIFLIVSIVILLTFTFNILGIINWPYMSVDSAKGCTKLIGPDETLLISSTIVGTILNGILCFITLSQNRSAKEDNYKLSESNNRLLDTIEKMNEKNNSPALNFDAKQELSNSEVIFKIYDENNTDLKNIKITDIYYQELPEAYPLRTTKMKDRICILKNSNSIQKLECTRSGDDVERSFYFIKNVNLKKFPISNTQNGGYFRLDFKIEISNRLDVTVKYNEYRIMAQVIKKDDTNNKINIHIYRQYFSYD